MEPRLIQMVGMPRTRVAGETIGATWRPEIVSIENRKVGERVELGEGVFATLLDINRKRGETWTLLLPLQRSCLRERTVGMHPQ